MLFLGSDGGVFNLCPVAPFGLRVAAGALRRLLDSCGGGDDDVGGAGGGAACGGTARAWLQAAFPGVVHPAGELLAEGEGFVVAPHLLETWAPALQGPLNEGSESAAAGRRPGAPRGVALAATARSAALGGRRLFHAPDEDGGGDYDGDASPGDGGDGGGVTCCAVVSAHDDGRLYAHALDASALAPAWVEGLPQCTYTPRMDVATVRCKCEAVPAAAGGGGDEAESMSMGITGEYGVFGGLGAGRWR